MSDLTLICKNCDNEFVFSQVADPRMGSEQTFYTQKGIPVPIYCPICRALKRAESLHPPKPKI